MKRSAEKTGARRALLLSCAVALAASALSCASSGYYRLNVQYVPQKQGPGADSTVQQLRIAAAQFNDERAVTDKSVIGRRVQSDNSEFKAVSQAVPATEAVGIAVKKAFQKNDFTVFGGTPDWDCTDRTIQKSWGDLVVGGFIEELEVSCATGFLATNYETKVKLRVVFGDAAHKRILYTTTLDSAASYSGFYFSQERMERELNAALSTAIEKMFENNKIEEALDQLNQPRVKNTTIQ